MPGPSTGVAWRNRGKRKPPRRKPISVRRRLWRRTLPSNSRSAALLRNPAEAPVAAGILGERLLKGRFAEIRPEALDKVQLGIGALPQQEIAQPLLATGANQQVDIRRRNHGMIHFRQALHKA